MNEFSKKIPVEIGGEAWPEKEERMGECRWQLGMEMRTFAAVVEDDEDSAVFLVDSVEGANRLKGHVEEEPNDDEGGEMGRRVLATYGSYGVPPSDDPTRVMVGRIGWKEMEKQEEEVEFVVVLLENPWSPERPSMG